MYIIPNFIIFSISSYFFQSYFLYDKCKPSIWTDCCLN